MQRIYTIPGNKPFGRSTTAWQRLGHGLTLAGLLTAGLFLAGCDLTQKKPLTTEEAEVYSGPSVVRGRPPAPPESAKPKLKPKKKPTTPPPVDTTGQSGGGPQGAAEPGQVTPDQTIQGATPPTDATPPDNASADTTGPADTDSGSQTASLPDHTAGSRPDDMIGRDENGIRALIGAPAKTRTEGSTTVWSYEKDGCSLDLFLFYDVKTGAQRVLSYEIKPSATDSNAIQACYNKFHNNV
ncbi:MAG TPA: hypothetical protein VM659_02730 [Dongiaceae bacterium]|nr:hypothetical protein [Dongiaceae bacterium]